MFDDIHSRAAALEARARQMQREEWRRLFGLAVSTLARGATRLARIGAAAAKGAAAGVHAALIEKDRGSWGALRPSAARYFPPRSL
jgi:hypothetical protein